MSDREWPRVIKRVRVSKTEWWNKIKQKDSLASEEFYSIF